MRLAVLLALEDDDESPGCLRKFCGLSLLERNLRLLRHCGIAHTIVLTTETGGQIAKASASARREDFEIEVVQLQAGLQGADELEALETLRDRFDGSFLAVRAEFVYDRRAVEAILSSQPNTTLVSSRPPVPGAHLPTLADRPSPSDASRFYYGLSHLLSALLDGLPDAADRFPSSVRGGPLEDLCIRNEIRPLALEDIPAYVVNLRRSLPVACFAVPTDPDREAGWRILIDATQKGALDWPAQYLHPVPENFLVKALLPTPVTPNQVTVVSNLCAFLALGSFWHGHLLAGVLLAMAVGVLDGVDGKLARVKLLYSKFGDRLDHVLDVIYEPLWYLAIGAFLSGGALQPAETPVALSVGIVALYFVDRATTGLFKRFKKVELFDCAPVDRFFRRIGARRNANVLILLAGLSANSPLGALWAIFGLTAITTLFHAIRALQIKDLEMGARPQRRDRGRRCRTACGGVNNKGQLYAEFRCRARHQDPFRSRPSSVPPAAGWPEVCCCRAGDAARPFAGCGPGRRAAA